MKSGLEILAVPCNQFKEQESGSSAEIHSFVKTNFGSGFPLLEKIEVNGDHPHPLYAYLRSNSELYDPKTKTSKVVPWNFAKFMLNP